MSFPPHMPMIPPMPFFPPGAPMMMPPNVSILPFFFFDTKISFF
jgi:hypothetical protein